MLRTLTLFLFFVNQINLYAEIKIIAHRGASGTLPEHTLESYSCACGMEADYLEPDLVMTKDGEVIVLHDIHLEPTTNVSELFPDRKNKDSHYYAADFNLAEIKSLSVHERVDHSTGKAIFPKRFPSSFSLFKIPTFREFLTLVKGLNLSNRKKIGIYPELKEPSFHKERKLDIIGKSYELLKEFGYDQRPEEIYFQCFELETLKELKVRTQTKIPLIYLTEDTKTVNLNEIIGIVDGIGAPIHSIVFKSKKGQWKRSSFTKSAQKAGLLIHTYTLRQDQLPKGFSSFIETLLTLRKLGIDAIFTDFPGLAKKTLRALPSR